MPSCPACHGEVPQDALFCAHCGGPLSSSSEVPTRLHEHRGSGTQQNSRQAISLSSGGGVSEGRFLPGAVLAGRYRIVALLGKGGMGEVYRADDLKLGQAVALKFLPESLQGDEDRLQRFLNEVRTARQVSHSNVCRVYDVGELDGHHYLSMEYVDGEDLASLLRRIGRLPRDKAIQLARQIAAGLATAHDAGVLHRDLKPANIMIDGRGRAKITDFGLAGLAGEIQQDDIQVGTPTYMAPEQLDGREVTVKSDLYALGLVLYELFTGKPPFKANTLAELRRLQTQSSPTSPSSFVEGFDPAVERLILRCLASEPSRRPQSALAVAMALPGGDPLAAAVAAGETPSPEMVAEAGAAEGLHPGLASALLAGFLAILGMFLVLGEQYLPVQAVPLPKPAQVLEEKAREILASLEYDEQPFDSLSAFVPEFGYIQEVLNREDAERLEALQSPQPAALIFYYRQSPYSLARVDGTFGNWHTEPANENAGMVRVGLDTIGRLVSLDGVPPSRDPDGEPAKQPDWNLLFSAAGFLLEEFTSVEPSRTPSSYADMRAAWKGVYPDAPEVAIRVEAAAYRGQPIFFRITDPPTGADATQPTLPSVRQRIGDWIQAVWFVVVLVGAGYIAYRNVKLGRGDRKTALRLALYVGAVRIIWYLAAHHAPATGEVGVLRGHLTWSIYRVGLVYIFYLALEPYVRRLWPKMLTSWVRLVDGRFRDPLVGRDILIGTLMGSLMGISFLLGPIIDINLGARVSMPRMEVWTLEPLRGMLPGVVAIFGIHAQTFLDLFMPVTMFLITRLILRRNWAAIALTSLLAVLMFTSGSGGLLVGELLGIALGVTLFWVTFLRMGFLALVVTFSVTDLMQILPLSFDFSSWHSGPTILYLLLLVGLAVYGFRTSLAGRPLLKDQMAADGGAADP